MKTQSAILVCLLLLFTGCLPGSLLAHEKKNDFRVQTKLILAIRKNSLPAVKQAVAEGADVAGYGYSIKNEIAENRRPLQEATEHGYLDIARFLVAKGAPIDSSDMYGITPLMLACQDGNLQMAKWLLQHGARVDASAVIGTPLFYACSTGHVEIVQLLLSYKANVNYRDASQRRTPLFYAASGGYPQVVKLLLRQGADVNAKNRSGETALTWAREKKQNAVIAILVAAGATE